MAADVQTRVPPDKKTMERFSVDGILDNSTTDFDLYLEVGETLTLYAKATYKWSREELQRLLAAGQRVLYYSTADKARVEAYRQVHALPKIDESAPPAQRVVSITNLAAELTKIIYKHPMTEVTLGEIRSVAQAMVRCVEEDRACIAALGLLANHDEYTYYHSARVSAYAVAIATQMSQKDPAFLTEIATGAMLHDVGKSRIDLGILNKRGAFTPDEWEAMKQHPVFGEAIVSPSLLAHAPREIILHHHERLDGTGYPHNLSDRELLEEVKIVAFADVYDALTTNRPYQIARTHYEALDLIRHKMLKNMHRESYEALVAIFGTGKKDESKT